MPYIYGSVTCDYIAELMYELDRDGTSISNPFPILDPSRAGLNIDHPFIKELYSIPRARVELLLQDMNSLHGTANIKAENVSDFLRNLEMVGKNIVETEDFSSVWKDNTNGDLIRAIESQRGDYIKTEVNNIKPVLHNMNPTYSPGHGINEVQSIRRLDLVDGQPERLIVESYGDICDFNPKSLEKARDLGYESLSSQTEYQKKGWTQPVGQRVIASYDMDLLVKAKKSTMSLAINFSVSEALTYRYQIFQNGETIFLNVNLNDPIIASKLTLDTETGKIVGITDSNSVLLLGEIFIEAMSRLLLEAAASASSRMLDNLNSYQSVVKIMKMYEMNVNKIEVAIHNVVSDYIKINFPTTQT